ncbi:hypothetical protein PINS_up012644 [Pythium insidiosum]|nr:hypothetical protein PINS_up012644 [Pythium insidiosum]
MGPKKASKGGKGASGGATSAGSAGVDRDASVVATNEYPLPRLPYELRKRVEEAEAQLREEAKIIERMTRDNRAKQEQINQMEALLAREIEKHQAAARMQEDEALTQRLQAEHEIEVLRRKVSQLELHVEAYDVLEASNRTLRERVERLMQQLEEENRSHAEEIHKVRLDMFNHKMALEKTFRKALQELDAEYLKKAFNAMSEESKNALVANAKLKDELQLQSIGVDNLMQRFNQQAKHYQKMRIENDILEQESHLRLQEVSSMKKAQLEATRTIEKLRDDVQREEQQWRQEANKTIEELRRENQHLTRLHELAQKRCHKWKTRCVELADRETQRRLEHSERSSSPPPQRAQTAPLAVIAGFSRSQSQPVLGASQPSPATTARNYDELWSASLAHRAAPSTERASTAQDATTSATARPASRKATRVVLPRNPQLVEFNFAR